MVKRFLASLYSIQFRPARKKQERKKGVMEGPDYVQMPNPILVHCLLSSAFGLLALPVPDSSCSPASRTQGSVPSAHRR